MHTEHKQKAPGGFLGRFFAQGQQDSPLETFPGVPRLTHLQAGCSGIRHTHPELSIAEMQCLSVRLRASLTQSMSHPQTIIATFVRF